MYHPAKSSPVIALFVTAGPAALDDLRWAATELIVAARSFTSGMSIRSVGFLATSRRSYSISSVSRRFLRFRGEAIPCRLYRAGTDLEAGCPCGSQPASRTRELASYSNCLDKPEVCAIIRRRTNDPIQTTQFALAAKYQRYGLAPE